MILIHTLARFFTALRRSRRGVAALEFAILFPVHLLLTLAIFDVSHCMFVSWVADSAENVAVRQLKTGALQAITLPSVYAGASNCVYNGTTTAVNYKLASGNNCIITVPDINPAYDAWTETTPIPAGTTSSNLFKMLLCSSTLLGTAVVNCNSFIYDLEAYNSWAQFNGALPQLTTLANGSIGIQAGADGCATSGGCALNFQPGTSSQIIVANFWYTYTFLIPWIARLMGGSNGTVTFHTVKIFQAEPF